MTVQPHEQVGALALAADQQTWTPQQLAALQHMGVEDATPGDLQVFLHQCQRTGLDPFARQVYMIGRQENVNVGGRWEKRTKYTIQTSIDGFRLIGRRAADAHAETIEITDTEWADWEGQWHDVWLSANPPAAARVAVIRNGCRFPGIALFREYAGTKANGELTKMWATKGALMIAKCAEALAWRKAFPQDLAGIYTSDEMSESNLRAEREAQAEQARVEQQQRDAVVPGNVVPEDRVRMSTDGQRRAMWAAASGAGVDEAGLRELIAQEVRPVESTKDLTWDEVSRVIDLLRVAEQSAQSADQQSQEQSAEAEPLPDEPPM